MFSKEEKKLYNSLFWGNFKKRMQKYRSKSGKKIDWLNYPTHIKFVYLRLEATESFVAVNFDSQPNDAGIRSIFWEQMGELKHVLTEFMKEDGIWLKDDNSETIGNFSRIQWRLDNVNYYKKEDTDKIYTFFQEKLIGFDDFYTEFGEILILLAK